MRSVLFISGAFILYGHFALAVTEPAQKTFSDDGWMLKCGASRMSDTVTCDVSKRIRVSSPKAGVFTISIDPDVGWIAVTGAPYVALAQTRADHGAARSCTGAICIIKEKAAAELQRELETSKTLYLDLTTVRGSYQFDLDLGGFQHCVAQAKSWGLWKEPRTGDAAPKAKLDSSNL